MTDHNMNAFFNDALGVGPALNYFFGVIDAGWWDVFVPAMVEFGDAFCAAFVEVYLFMEWLFVGGGICNITAKDWEQTLGNTWSVGGLEELGNLDKWHNVEEKTNDLLMIACSAYWMILEYCYLWLSFAIACIGMMIRKCKVLGGSNPSIETALSLSSTLTMGFAGLPPIFIQVKPMISAGVAFCITSFAEKQCYIYFSIGVKYSVIFPPLEGYKFDCCEMDMCLVINGYPTKDGYCNGWGIAGTLTCAPFMCGGNPTPIHIEMRCVFFYRNYWFKFNSISLRCVISISLPYVKFAWSAEIGLTTMKIWVAVCVMARVAKTCRMFYTGEDPNYEKAWNNYQNDGFVPTMNPGDQAGAFSGYGTN